MRHPKKYMYSAVKIMSIPLGVSQVVSYYKEWQKSGGDGVV